MRGMGRAPICRHYVIKDIIKALNVNIAFGELRQSFQEEIVKKSNAFLCAFGFIDVLAQRNELLIV